MVDWRMSKQLVSNALWAIIAPLLPPERLKPKGGRPRIADWAVLTGILFVLKSAIPWEMLPEELDLGVLGSGMTCWPRLRDWQHAAVWKRLHRALLQRLQDAGQMIEWERASLDSADSARVPAPRGGQAASRGRPRWPPPGGDDFGANVHDSRLLEAVVDARRCTSGASAPRIDSRGIESSERLGRLRSVVEQTLSWLNCFRGLKVRYERGADRHLAFLVLGCALVCWRAMR